MVDQVLEFGGDTGSAYRGEDPFRTGSGESQHACDGVQVVQEAGDLVRVRWWAVRQQVGQVRPVANPDAASSTANGTGAHATASNQVVRIRAADSPTLAQRGARGVGNRRNNFEPVRRLAVQQVIWGAALSSDAGRGLHAAAGE